VQGFPAIPWPISGATFGRDMSLRRRDLVALVVVAFTFLLGTIAWSTGPGVTGMHLVLQNDQVVIASVDPGSPAALNGVQTGMIVVALDNSDVLGASLSTKASIVANPRGWQWLEALWPDQIPAELAAREQLAREQAAQAASTPTLDGPPEGQPIGQDINFPGYSIIGFYFPDVYRSNSLPAVYVGLAILIVGIWWLGTGRAGPSLRRVAITLPAATAMPLFALPVQLMPTLPFLVSSFVVVPAGMMPLAADFCDRLDDRPLAVHLRRVVAVLASASVLAGVTFVAGADFGWHSTWSAVLAGCVAFVPGLLAARPAFLKEAADASGSAPAPGRFVESTELMLAAATPAVALTVLVFRDWNPFLWPLLIWLAAILLARRFTLRPLLRLANRATFQRDVVVAATEAERARIAADIHDDALQDLTMLVRRLDAAGDAENAEAAREIATRLRTICGELRLPILDDLGLGPALDWLAERFEPIARGPVYLERTRDEQRPPANVELALFRIAQEALNNAVKHGAPPIVVRYRAGGTWAELDVDDAGPGLPPGAAELAEQTGHLGLLTMTQRSEAVGAELQIGRRPGGGTRVSVVWEASASAAHVAEGASGAAATATALPQP
jgi:signal transduction histidine kinase